MNVLLKVLRWFLFLPVGLLAGQLAAAVFCALALLAFAWSTPLSGVTLLLTGVLQPLVGGSVGLWVAPAGSRWCRTVLNVAYGLLGGTTIVLIVCLLIGQSPETHLSRGLPSLSSWWCLLLHSVGLVYGCVGVGNLPVGGQNPTSPQGPTHSPSSNPLSPVPSPFRWDAAN